MKLLVRAVPNARVNEIVGWELDPHAGPVLKVRVAAQPIDGKANAALREFLAKSLQLAKSRITLDKGGNSRKKTFHLPDETVIPAWPMLF